jgi:hypothetical protein
MEWMKRFAPIALVSFLLAGCLWPEANIDFPPMASFDHLDHLTERIYFQGDSVSIVHIYANYPDYAWVGAAESGPEGIACVDDAARAAVVSLRHYELTRDQESLSRARGLLAFVEKMQTGDGDFYNFIFADHTINESGVTSQKSFGWWGTRGIWALATGCRVLASVDPPLATQMAGRVRLSLPRIDSLLRPYDQFGVVRGFRVPTWLPYRSGADVSSELMLGLSEYVAATQDISARLQIKKIADGLIMMQDGDASTYPYGLHRSWETMWHMWGNGQTQALATAGRLLHDSALVASAEREARGFYSRLLIQGFFKEMNVADSSSRIMFEQIAYGVRPMSVGLLRLYEATGKEEYLVMAGLAASWLLGNNSTGLPLYDPATGRCYDGIRDSSTINRNSGAESTIEALGTLLEVEHYDRSRLFMHARKTATISNGGVIAALFAVHGGEDAVVAVDLKKQSLVVLTGREADRYFEAVNGGTLRNDSRINFGAATRNDAMEYTPSYPTRQ